MPIADKKSPAKAHGLTNTGAAASRPRKTAASKAPAAPASIALPSKRDLSLGRILDAAVHLFATKGYWNSSLEEVAKVAGFTKGAVYYHFKSKERLLLKVLEIIEARSIDATIEHVHHRGGSPPQRLESFVKYQTQWAAMHPEDLAVMILMSVEFSRAKSKIRSQMSRIYNKLGGTLETIIDSGKASGDFTTRQNTKDIVLYLQAVHDGNMLIWYRSGNDPEIGRKLTRATLNGFAHAVQGS